MGNISIDKHITSLEDLFAVPTKHLIKDRQEFYLQQDSASQHLKIWRFDAQKVSKGVSATEFQTNFEFQQNECYLILLMYRKTEKERPIISFPHGLQGLVKSSSNLTPRGLENIFASSETQNTLESILLSKSSTEEEELHFMLFVWNGSQANSLLKAITLTKGFELLNLLTKNLKQESQAILKFLFNGGVVRQNKLQKGQVSFLDSLTSSSSETNKIDENSIPKTNFLLKWFFSQNNQSKFPLFNKVFITDKIERNKLFTSHGIPDKNQFQMKIEEKKQQSISQQSQQQQAKQEQFKLNFNNIKPEQNKAAQIIEKQDQGKGIPNQINQKSESNQAIQMQLKFPERDQQQFDNPPQASRVPPKIEMKQAVLKTREQERQEIEYNPEIHDEYFDMRDTNRKQLKLEYYSSQISEVEKDFLYVGGVKIANSMSTLKNKQITHIINTAGDCCSNYYPNEFNYLTFFLKDGKGENIESCFYYSINFIEKAKESKGRVFVHCQHGASRSISICMAYIMWRNPSLSMPLALEQLRTIRGIAGPNQGFQVQLIYWHKRLNQMFNEDQWRVWIICSHCTEQPHNIVFKFLFEEFQSQKFIFDPRGLFIITNAKDLFLWRGSKISPANKTSYQQAAEYFAREAHKYDKITAKLVEIENPPQSMHYQIEENQQWDKWLLPLDQYKDQEAHDYIVEEEEEEETVHFPLLYIYPDSVGIKHFDDDDLMEDSLLLLATKSKLFIWRGAENEVDQVKESSYIKKVLQIQYQGERVEQQIEDMDAESKEFLSYFYDD